MASKGGLLEALIAKGKNAKRPKEQREVAFGLADTSTHPQLHVQMVNKGAVKALQYLLERADDKEAQRFAALALANVCHTKENRIPIAEQGIFKPLVNYISNPDADIIGRQYARADMHSRMRGPFGIRICVFPRAPMCAPACAPDMCTRAARPAGTARWRSGTCARQWRTTTRR